ncbi:hypothetical protein EPUL_005590, partial [Erysiphe pulchra]
TVDTTNRIHKPASNSGRGQLSAASKIRSNSQLKAVIRNFAVSIGSQVAMPQADSSPESTDNNMDDKKNSVNDCDTLCEATEEKKKEPTRCQKHKLMSKARGLLNLVGPYLEEMEKEFLGSEADFLALISEKVSRSMQGKEIYMKNPATTANISLTRKNENRWAAKTAAGNINRSNIDLRRPPIRPNPPRIMIRLDKEHEARKTEPYLIRQKIQKLISDPTLVVDTWQVPSGVTILAPTPAKASTSLQQKDVISQRFGNATVERQESWATFVVEPEPKKVTTLDGTYDPMDGLLLQEPEIGAIKDELPI